MNFNIIRKGLKYIRYGREGFKYICYSVILRTDGCIVQSVSATGISNFTIEFRFFLLPSREERSTLKNALTIQSKEAPCTSNLLIVAKNQEMKSHPFFKSLCHLPKFGF